MLMRLKKIKESEFLIAHDLLKDLRFNRLKFNDKLENKLGKHAKHVLKTILRLACFHYV